ncbi:MAG: DEAD/DEAH box helicase family protein [Candidatus Methanoplasma sp.]|jgi:type I restriction enzyme R subunit|nr:DEAD/DEAH box helicase family protein [Candidatus Methanoplasma sp.]
MTPEAKARENIDRMLRESGYVLQDMYELNPNASTGVVVREYPTDDGPVDYLIFIDGEPAGMIEAKAENKGSSLGDASEQSERYANSRLKYSSKDHDIRFIYESTGVITYFRDRHDSKARSREVFSFHRPETLAEWRKERDTLRNRMGSFPPLDHSGFRACQVTAIANLEKSFSDNKPRALVQMATGAGKTYTAITSVYRLLKHAGAKRILFLVDTKNLGEQAESEFLSFKPYDDAHCFSELYPVRRINSSFISKDTKVCIITIQRMYSILCGEDFDESDEETSPSEINRGQGPPRPREVVYSSVYPPEFFDFIVIDECHRSIYNVWQQVLDYFDAFYIGLTATPDNRTFAFFKQNIVSEYSHEDAVIDDVNVGREGTYLIQTKIGTDGAIIAGGTLESIVEKRDRLSRKKSWEQLDEDLEYEPLQLDKDIVNPSQIRTVITEFKRKIPEMFPDRFDRETGKMEVPKTLVFAKMDSHADDIVNIMREVFSEGNEFCKKITYSADDPKSVLSSFRNEYYPRIAVTVDMISTGTDVRPIECLVFMRDVRSKSYFEQMLGRATRTISHDDLCKVSPSATRRKLGFIVIDAVGVTTSKKTTSRQLECIPTEPLKSIMMRIAMGDLDRDTLTTMAARMIRLDKEMTGSESKKFTEIAKVTCPQIARNLLNAFDEDAIRAEAIRSFGTEQIPEEKFKETSAQMAASAARPFSDPKLREYILSIRKIHDQIIDRDNIDFVTYSEWDSENKDKAEKTIETFANFIEDNMNTIEALEIIYGGSYRTRHITYEMIKEIHDVMQGTCHLTVEKVWRAYRTCNPDKVRESNPVNLLTDIISLIRFQLGHVSELHPFRKNVEKRFQQWTFDKQKGALKYTEEQMEWLRMIRDHICASFCVSPDDLEYTPFDSKGGLGRFFHLFGSDCKILLDEMSAYLVEVA